MYKKNTIEKNIEINKYKKIKEFLKSKSKVHINKKAKVFDKTDIEIFLKNGSNDIYLRGKIVVFLLFLAG